MKTAGDEVFAGTLNRDGALRVQVSRPASDSVVARIVALVEQATKAPTQLSSNGSSPATQSPWSPRRCCCSPFHWQPARPCSPRCCAP